MIWQLILLLPLRLQMRTTCQLICNLIHQHQCYLHITTVHPHCVHQHQQLRVTIRCRGGLTGTNTYPRPNTDDTAGEDLDLPHNCPAELEKERMNVYCIPCLWTTNRTPVVACKSCGKRLLKFGSDVHAHGYHSGSIQRIERGKGLQDGWWELEIFVPWSRWHFVYFTCDTQFPTAQGRRFTLGSLDSASLTCEFSQI